MSFNDERYAIENLFLSQWADLANGIPVLVEGLTPPWGNDPPNVETYLRLDIMTGRGDRTDIGAVNPRYRFPGIVQVLIVDTAGQGTGNARDLADDIADIFRGAQFGIGMSGLLRVQKPPSISQAIVKGDRIQLPVSIEYIRDVIYTTPEVDRMNVEQFAISGPTSSITLQQAYTMLLVWLNGDLLTSPDDYTFNGLAMTPVTPFQAGDSVVVAGFSGDVRIVTSGAVKAPAFQAFTGAVNGVNKSFVLPAVPLLGHDIALLAAPPSTDFLYAYTWTASKGVGQEIPSGACDGTNKTFALKNDVDLLILFQQGVVLTQGVDYTISARVFGFLNGQLLRQGVDYTISRNMVTMTNAPATGDKLKFLM